MIGTLEEPHSAVLIQSLATMPNPFGNPLENLDWEMTKAIQKFGNKGGIDFTDVSYINRVLVKDGQKPSKEFCTQDIEGGTVNLVYSAVYWFWGQ